LQQDDSKKVISSLNKAGFRVTKLDSAGGFLSVGNATLLIGVSPDNLNQAISIIESKSKSRSISISSAAMPYMYSPAIGYEVGSNFEPADDSIYNTEIKVGGATIFVLNCVDNNNYIH
jgi:uncharacterized protein YaaQ